MSRAATRPRLYPKPRAQHREGELNSHYCWQCSRNACHKNARVSVDSLRILTGMLWRSPVHGSDGTQLRFRQSIDVCNLHIGLVWRVGIRLGCVSTNSFDLPSSEAAQTTCSLSCQPYRHLWQRPNQKSAAMHAPPVVQVTGTKSSEQLAHLAAARLSCTEVLETKHTFSE